LHNETIAETLTSVRLKAGAAEIGNNLTRCYETLVAANIFPHEEIALLEASIDDVSAIKQRQQT
jgi:hypothetical protein